MRGDAQAVRIELVDALVGFDVTPDTLLVERGARVVLDVVNAGRERHDLAVHGGQRTRTLAPGESQRLDLGRLDGRRTAVCTLPGHELAGMTLEIRAAAG
ncbi:MAG TPA: hypothetical protein VGO80_09630 [Solirubrobacteraceae bacterium]|jgi:nitrite reductase (NO-forming)|nr:hypothetical protein [Solirubrobacteraceae bacterium]